jgi:EthD domain
LHHFDGIAFFEVPRHVNFVDAFNDPYYAEYIEPDENRFIDKAGEGGGLLATYEGRTVTLVEHGKSVIGEKGNPELKRWMEFEIRAQAKMPKEFRARL